MSELHRSAPLSIRVCEKNDFEEIYFIIYEAARVGRNKRSALRRMGIDGTGISSCVGGANPTIYGALKSGKPFIPALHGLT